MIRRALAAPRATVAVLGGTGAVAALLFVAIGGSIWGPEESAGSATPTESTIAVLPFSVRGGEELAFLGEGMVDLLSATLDGGGLHVVDPRAVLAVVGHEGALAPADARAVAERLGARRYVLGDIVESGGRLRVAVLLYDTDGGERAVAQSAAQGSTSDVIPLADTLTARLLAALPGEPTTRLTRLAVATTPSLPALKAYLEGERQFRALRLEDASTALRRAITEDSTFALAWYRLSVVASWRLRHAEAREAIDRALRHSGSLSERGQRLVQAFHAYANGRPDDAERAYRTLLGVYPDDLEASNLLGELLFHFNFLRGRSLLESRQPWEQVLSHEPENRAALLHLAQIASVERDGAAVDSLMRAYLAGAPEDVRTLLPRLFRAMATGDTAARDRILAEFRGASEIALVVTVWNVAVYTGDLDGSIALARMLVDPARSPEARALGHIVLAHLLSARGRRSAAQHHLDSAARTRPLWAAEHRALLTAATPIAATTAEVDSARATLARAAAARGQPPTGEVSPNLWMIVHEDVHPELRRYLEGLLALRSGERGTALAAARDLAATHADGDAAKLARGLADGLRARVALQEGRAGIAATLLDSARLSVPFELAWVSPFFSQADDRFVRAELLARLGRDREALHWFGGFEENSVYDLVYAAPARLRRGEILERLGEREAAIAEYRRVVELWSGGDDDAGRAVADVQARIRRLLGGG